MNDKQALGFWKNMALELKDELLQRNIRIFELEKQLARARKWLPDSALENDDDDDNGHWEDIDE